MIRAYLKVSFFILSMAFASISNAQTVEECICDTCPDPTNVETVCETTVVCECVNNQNGNKRYRTQPNNCQGVALQNEVCTQMDVSETAEQCTAAKALLGAVNLPTCKAPCTSKPVEDFVSETENCCTVTRVRPCCK